MENILFLEKVQKEPHYVDIANNNWLMIAYDFNKHCFDKLLFLSTIRNFIKSILHKSDDGRTIFDFVKDSAKRISYESKLCDMAYDEMIKDNLDINGSISLQNETLLLVSLNCGNYNVAGKLLEHKTVDTHCTTTVNHNVLSFLGTLLKYPLTDSVSNLIKKLIQSNYDINTRYPIDASQTLLSLISERLYVEVDPSKRCDLIDLIIEKKECAVNTGYCQGNVYSGLLYHKYPLHPRIRKIVKQLFKHPNFDINQTLADSNGDNDTPLIRAMYDRDYELSMEILDNNECKLYQKNKPGHTAIDYFAMRCFGRMEDDQVINIIKKLASREDFDFNRPLITTATLSGLLSGTTLLECAIYNKMYPISKHLLSYSKCKPTNRCVLILLEERRTNKMSIECLRESDNLLKDIVERKDFEVTCKIDEYCNILEYAEKYSMVDVLKMCLDIHINRKSDQDMTLIEYSVKFMSSDMIHNILSHPRFVPDSSYNLKSIRKGMNARFPGLYHQYMDKNFGKIMSVLSVLDRVFEKQNNILGAYSNSVMPLEVSDSSK